MFADCRANRFCNPHTEKADAVNDTTPKIILHFALCILHCAEGAPTAPPKFAFKNYALRIKKAPLRITARRVVAPYKHSS